MYYIEKMEEAASYNSIRWTSSLLDSFLYFRYCIRNEPKQRL